MKGRKSLKIYYIPKLEVLCLLEKSLLMSYSVPTTAPLMKSHKI